MKTNYVPPKGYSNPRNAPKSEVRCQRCNATSHWTFECTVASTNIHDAQIENVQNDITDSTAPPDTRNPMFRPIVEDKTGEMSYTTMELAEVKEALREEIRKELMEKFEAENKASENLMPEVECPPDSDSDDSD